LTNDCFLPTDIFSINREFFFIFIYDMEEKPAFITAKKHLEQVQSENIKNILASLFEILHSHETLLQEIEENLDQLQEDSEEEDPDFEVCETFAKRKK
jgi:hypothetical protein